MSTILMSTLEAVSLVPHERVQSQTHVQNSDVCDSRVFQDCVEVPVSQLCLHL